MEELAAMAHPALHPGVKPLRESRYPKSHRFRPGRFRLLFVVLPDEGAIVFTTAFLERRKEDYHHAVRVHDARIKACE